jgi:hypothetical protein
MQILGVHHGRFLPHPIRDPLFLQFDLLLSLFNDSINVGNIHGVHCADFSVRGAARRHFSRQAAQLFRTKLGRKMTVQSAMHPL